MHGLMSGTLQKKIGKSSGQCFQLYMLSALKTKLCNTKSASDGGPISPIVPTNCRSGNQRLLENASRLARTRFKRHAL